MAINLMRKLFTVRDFNRMVEAGILTKYDRVELIRGEIVEMAPVGRREAACRSRLNKVFYERLGDKVLVGIQDAVELNDVSQPQPDVCWLRFREDFYESGHPQVRDIFLLVEVADTTVEFDREVKIPLYADAGICEVWLVDIQGECLEVYRHPLGGKYEEVLKFFRGDRVGVSAFSDVEFGVDEVLGSGG
ncbi:Uma2 family endonuclease [Ancylothrix sp. C2]|uniref:Uma2 family endonuclease n=1 Tax=Ancylothrix sp. D3o TaxID=2953691 RepID=UPI0021BAD2FB|nr:Uma2 family endonuclease [Ancylothrix sp. D3o]MCT7948765.1 Uma2 family endonuclease [Ancylothrix sp. D3o]